MGIVTLLVYILPILFILLGICLLTFLIYLFVEYIYFSSEGFNSIKSKVSSFVDECNDLNGYIEDLKSFYSNISSQNFGYTTEVDNSNWNFTKKHWSNFDRSDRIHNCSLLVLTNAKKHPIKYFCKYFNVEPNQDNLENFEKLLNSFVSVDQGKVVLENKRHLLLKSIEKEIPFFIKNFSKNKLISNLGFKPLDLRDYYPSYSFQYISPGGNKNLSESLVLNIPNISDLVYFISEKVKFRRSIYGQRLLMTPKLREYIKKRDGYRCVKCGISNEDEKNLLLEIDHITPLAKGGITSESNLQTLCWKCNRSKGKKLI